MLRPPMLSGCFIETRAGLGRTLGSGLISTPLNVELNLILDKVET